MCHHHRFRRRRRPRGELEERQSVRVISVIENDRPGCSASFLSIPVCQQPGNVGPFLRLTLQQRLGRVRNRPDSLQTIVLVVAQHCHCTRQRDDAVKALKVDVEIPRVRREDRYGYDPRAKAGKECHHKVQRRKVCEDNPVTTTYRSSVSASRGVMSRIATGHAYCVAIQQR